MRSPALEYVEYYDAESGLLVGRKEMQPSPAGEVEMTGQVGGYKRFGDVLVPTIWTHKTAQQEWTAVYETIEFDNVSPHVFTVPKMSAADKTQ